MYKRLEQTQLFNEQLNLRPVTVSFSFTASKDKKIVHAFNSVALSNPSEIDVTTRGNKKPYQRKHREDWKTKTLERRVWLQRAQPVVTHIAFVDFQLYHVLVYAYCHTRTQLHIIRSPRRGNIRPLNQRQYSK